MEAYEITLFSLSLYPSVFMPLISFVFCSVRVASKEIRSVDLPRNSCLIFKCNWRSFLELMRIHAHLPCSFWCATLCLASLNVATTAIHTTAVKNALKRTEKNSSTLPDQSLWTFQIRNYFLKQWVFFRNSLGPLACNIQFMIFLTMLFDRLMNFRGSCYTPTPRNFVARLS